MKDLSEPQWDIDSIDSSIEEDVKDYFEKLEDAKKDVLKLKTDEEKKSQVQKQFLVRVEEVEKLNRDNAEKFSLIRDVKAAPDEIKTQFVAVKVRSPDKHLKQLTLKKMTRKSPSSSPVKILYGIFIHPIFAPLSNNSYQWFSLLISHKKSV